MKPGDVWIAPNGRLYKWYRFGNWNCTKELEGVEETELHLSALEGQKPGEVIKHLIDEELLFNPNVFLNQSVAIRMDFKTVSSY